MKNHKFVNVVEVEELDYNEDVYDITVQDNHNFFANGVVVHNCLGGIFSSVILKGEAYGKTTEQIILELKKLTEQFIPHTDPDSFFLELQFNKLPKQHVVNRYLIELSKQTGVKLITTCDSHYPDPSKWQARELYKKLGWMKSKVEENATLPRFEDLKCELYPKNASQLWDEFLKTGLSEYEFYRGNEEIVKDSIERTHDIAWQMCEDSWIDASVKLPKFVSQEKSEFNQLVDIVKEKFESSKYKDDPIYVERIKKELSDIKFLKCSSYFLTLYAVLNDAEKSTLIGPGRGSGAGSLVNYILGITNVDPIRYSLLWERFLSRQKVSWPDVDTDAANRDVLIQSAKKLFGDDAVIPVSNFNLMKLKSLLKVISKFYGVPLEEVNGLTKTLQQDVEPLARGEDVEKSVYVLTHEDCMEHSQKYREFLEKYPDVAAHISVLFSQNANIGRHAGGVLIADPELLEKTMPIISVRGDLQTSWSEGMNFRHLESNGFLKFDFLGLTLLRNVEDCIRRILRRVNKKEPDFSEVKDFFDKNMNCRYVSLDDPTVWRHVYHEGRFVGIFQFENSGARKFCTQAKPNSIDDLSAITAIYRPGPLKANVHHMYVAAGEDPSQQKYEHPLMKPILGPTRSFLIYQEQFMKLAVDLAGFSLGDADQMRKTLVKKSLDTNDKKAGERAELRKKFVEGSQKLHGIDSKVSNEIFDKIEFFALYGFNAAHSVSYAIDSYYAAWLHTHYEKDWLATILQSETGNPKGLAKKISEIKSLGYKFSKVDINYSDREWKYSDELEAFIPALSSVKGIGSAAVEEIMVNRPYKDLKDMLYDNEGEWRHSKVNKTVLSALCQIEGLESLEDFQNGKVLNHRQLLLTLTENKNYENIRKGLYGLTASQLKKKIKSGETITPIIDLLLKELEETSDWTRDEKISLCFDLTSTIDADLLFPPEVMEKVLSKEIPRLHDIPEKDEGIGWFCVQTVEMKQTKNKKIFYRCKVIDDEFRIAYIRVWGSQQEEIKPYTLWVGKAHNDPNWGFSTSIFKMRQMV